MMRCYLVLPSPVDRKEKRFKAFTTHMYHVNPDSEVASILEPDKKYTIRLATADLNVRWHAYGEHDQLVSDQGKPLQSSGKEKLVRSKSTFSAGHARFKAVSSLPWPPKVRVSMRICSSVSCLDDSRMEQSITHSSYLSPMKGTAPSVFEAAVECRGFEY